MEARGVLHMNGGEGDVSYASNSKFQRAIITMVKPNLEETILNLIDDKAFLESGVLHIADLGCSSGHSLSVIYHILKTITAACQQLHCKPPEFQVSLNDLPGNDFNTIFRRTDDPSCDENCKPWKMILLALRDIGVIEEGQIDSFNVPYYAPSAAEVRDIVLLKGSFNLTRLISFDVGWDLNTVSDTNLTRLHNWRKAAYVSKFMRAVLEPMLSSHFGGITSDGCLIPEVHKEGCRGLQRRRTQVLSSSDHLD
ncbi:hypothetical protein Sjap_011514 [Stephania japonica]|uniref:Uncharacterized protein n=1 Tax=Stephania japonica TaxID=461633 RepID=A0AAP0JDM9_9MAGN